MISATLFNNLFVPPFYVILQGFGEWLGRSKRTGETLARTLTRRTEPHVKLH